MGLGGTETQRSNNEDFSEIHFPPHTTIIFIAVSSDHSSKPILYFQTLFLFYTRRANVTPSVLWKPNAHWSCVLSRHFLHIWHELNYTVNCFQGKKNSARLPTVLRMQYLHWNFFCIGLVQIWILLFELCKKRAFFSRLCCDKMSGNITGIHCWKPV